MTRRDTLCALAWLLGLGACSRREAASGGGAELQLDYAILIDQGEPTPVAGNHHFRSGDRFRVQLRPQFPAYLYLLNRGADANEYSFLYPHDRVAQTNPVGASQTVTLPGGEWYTLDNRPGLENLVLLASTHAMPDFAGASGPVPRDRFEATLAVLERDHGPVSSRRMEDKHWVKLFATCREDTVLVVRLPLDHT